MLSAEGGIIMTFASAPQTGLKSLAASFLSREPSSKKEKAGKAEE